MNQPQNFLKILVALWMLSAGALSHAFDPNGVWHSSTGSTIQISANMQSQQYMDITIRSKNGQQTTVAGYWTKGGESFVYQASNVKNYAQFFDSNQIQIEGTDGGKVTWNRVQQPAPPASNPTNDISGLWRSSSGSSIQLNSQGNQVIVTLIDKNGKRFQGSGRWLKSGSTFDYSLPGYPGVATCSIVNKNQINVAYPDAPVTSWYRQ